MTLSIVTPPTLQPVNRMVPTGQVVAKYDTKLNCIHSKACADRQEDWSEDQDCWCRVHESTYKQQDDIN